MHSKERLLEEIIDPLKEISSEEFQEKGWVLGEVHDYCRFAGTICRLYDYGHLEDFIDQYAKQFGLSDLQTKKLDRFRHALNDYIDKNGCYEEPDIILKDPEWHKIRKQAKECLEIFQVYKYLDPSRAIPKESLLTLISYLESSEFLERIWINERKPGRNPFSEWMDKFFNHYAYKTKEIIEHYREYEVTDQQQRYLVNLYNALKVYWGKMKNEEDLHKILKDPEWHQIQSLSREVLVTFGWKPPSDD